MKNNKRREKGEKNLSFFYKKDINVFTLNFNKKKESTSNFRIRFKSSHVLFIENIKCQFLSYYKEDKMFFKDSRNFEWKKRVEFKVMKRKIKVIPNKI